MTVCRHDGATQDWPEQSVQQHCGRDYEKQQCREGAIGRGVDERRQDRPCDATTVRPGVPKEAEEDAHSVNRYFMSTHNATRPSRQVIFFPSS